MHRQESLVEKRWNAEYGRGRYSGEAPVEMITRILAAARARNIDRGLYIGCGNGRNYLPLRRAGLDLTGIDISAEAIAQLRQLLPDLPAGCLQRGTVQDLAPGISFPLVIGIQVFQHGTGAAAAAHIRAAGARVSPGGIFAIRVNAAGTDVHPAHRVIEEKDGAFTVEYLDGPKRGLDIHFFSGPELSGLLESAGFDEIESLRQVTHERVSPQPGSWRQWEGIWKARS
jgi:trans-aconitate methyltransferase